MPSRLRRKAVPENKCCYCESWDDGWCEFLDWYCSADSDPCDFYAEDAAATEDMEANANAGGREREDG